MKYYCSFYLFAGHHYEHTIRRDFTARQSDLQVFWDGPTHW